MSSNLFRPVSKMLLARKGHRFESSHEYQLAARHASPLGLALTLQGLGRCCVDWHMPIIVAKLAQQSMTELVARRVGHLELDETGMTKPWEGSHLFRKAVLLLGPLLGGLI